MRNLLLLITFISLFSCTKDTVAKRLTTNTPPPTTVTPPTFVPTVSVIKSSSTLIDTFFVTVQYPDSIPSVPFTDQAIYSYEYHGIVSQDTTSYIVADAYTYKLTIIADVYRPFYFVINRIGSAITSPYYSHI